MLPNGMGHLLTRTMPILNLAVMTSIIQLIKYDNMRVKPRHLAYLMFS